MFLFPSDGSTYATLLLDSLHLEVCRYRS